MVHYILAASSHWRKRDWINSLRRNPVSKAWPICFLALMGTNLTPCWLPISEGGARDLCPYFFLQLPVNVWGTKTMIRGGLWGLPIEDNRSKFAVILMPLSSIPPPPRSVVGKAAGPSTVGTNKLPAIKRVNRLDEVQSPDPSIPGRISWASRDGPILPPLNHVD